MSILESVQEKLAIAIKQQDKTKINIYRVIIGECDRKGKNLPDVDVLRVLKTINDNLTITNTDESKLEQSIISEFMPKQLTTEEMDAIIDNVISSNPDTQFGQLMKICIAECKGIGDNKYISVQLKSKLG